MNTNPQHFAASSPAPRLVAVAAAMLMTAVSFSAVVSLADDQPMAIAGITAHRTVAQKAQPAGLRLAAASVVAGDETQAR